MAVMLVGAVCMGFDGAVQRGQISLPWHWPYLAPGTVLSYLVLPLLTLTLLGYRPLRYLALGRWGEVLPLFLVFLVVVLACSMWLSSLAAVRAAYPALVAGQGTSLLLATFFTTICVEFFFRGFLLLPLFTKFSWYALPIVAMPYCLIHVGKPLVELFGSIAFALGLSYLAVRSGSIVYGVVLHWLLAVAIPLWLSRSG